MLNKKNTCMQRGPPKIYVIDLGVAVLRNCQQMAVLGIIKLAADWNRSGF